MQNQYDIKEITEKYLSICPVEGDKYLSEFPLEVIQKVRYELFARAARFFKEVSGLELNCSEHGCLESHF